MALLNTTGFEQKKVGLAELAASDDPDVVLASHWLGSGLGLTLYDPSRRVGGMLHAILPESALDREKAAQRPALFVDAGLRSLLEEVLRLGAGRERLQVALAGGAQVLDAHPLFNAGQRNWDAALRILNQLGFSLPPAPSRQQHFGRISLALATGETRLEIPGEAKPLVLWKSSTVTSTK